MFDLQTKQIFDTSKKHFTGVIINTDGNLESFHYVIEGSYYFDINTKNEYDTYIDTFKNKIITIGNISKYEVIEPKVLKTKSLNIKSNENMFYQKEWNEGVWGNNFMDCFHLGLRNAIYSKIYEGGRMVPNMDTYLAPYVPPVNSIPLRLVIVNDDGLKVVNGILHHEFVDDRSESCPSCVQGMITYEQTIDKIGRHVIANTKKAKFDGSFIHDMDTTNDETITKSLTEAFHHNIVMAKIKSIRFEELK